MNWWEIHRVLFLIVCSPNPCANGGTCTLTTFNNDYTCQCVTNLPLGGKNCDQLIAVTTTAYPS